MSAINPASFVTPTAGLQSPGVAGLGFAPEMPTERRAPHDSRNFNAAATHLSQANPSPRDFLERGDFGGNAAVRNTYVDPYLGLQGLGSNARQHNQVFGRGSPSHDPFSPIQLNGYGGVLDSVGSDYLRAGPASNRQRTDPPQADWIGGFQGLSLNS